MKKDTTSKNYVVALDNPGAGWSGVLKARSLDRAKKLATKKYREAPDTVYQVAPNFKKEQKAKKEQENYDNLGPTNFLVALEVSGGLKNIDNLIDNKKIVKAIKSFIKLQKTINPHLFKEVKRLVGTDTPCL